MIGNGTGGAVAGAALAYGAAVPLDGEDAADVALGAVDVLREAVASGAFFAVAGSFAHGGVSAVDPALAGAAAVLALRLTLGRAAARRGRTGTGCTTLTAPGGRSCGTEAGSTKRAPPMRSWRGITNVFQYSRAPPS